MTGRTIVANGNITPFSAIKLDTSADQRAILGTAGVKCIGISQKGVRNAPYSSLDDGYAAIADENLMYYADGEENVPAKLAGTVTRGDYLKSNGSGLLIATTSDGDWAVAQARQSGVSGDIIAVDVRILQLAS